MNDWVAALADPFANSSVHLIGLVPLFVPLFDSFVEPLVATSADQLAESLVHLVPWVDSLVDSLVRLVPRSDPLVVHKMGTGIERAEI